MEAILFAPADSSPTPRASWHASDFTSVDDTVRGGSSTSSMTVKNSSDGIDFSGFLDTTTLGGAGFASQAYSKNGQGFPGSVIDGNKYCGLRLVVASPQSSSADSRSGKDQAGGGKAPVTRFVLNLKPTIAPTRPDGRKESTVVYEYSFDASKSDKDGTMSILAEWNQFNATYRGRPADDAEPLDPSQVREWSIMARSNFAEQSGPFSLRLVSLSALPASSLHSREYLQSDNSYVSPPDVSGPGEYYGFALFIVATLVMVLWVLWALVPDRILHQFGIDWYPNREWAFLIPAWSMFAVLFTYAVFLSLNIHKNPPLDDLRQLVAPAMSHHQHHEGCGHEHDDDHIKPGEGQQDFLYSQIDRDNVTALNEQTSGMGRKTIKSYDKIMDETEYLESDADDQLIIRIPFTGVVKLRALMLKAGPADLTPSEIFVYSNLETLDFDEASDEVVKATQKLSSIAVTREQVSYPLKTAKFNNVRSVTLFIPRAAGANTSRIYFIGFKGEWLGTQRREGPSNIVYESSPQVKDHTKIPGTESGSHTLGPGS
ncbi:hypothetical protein CBS101457_000654 [Exobasidium rhododendri]|nr:hypothetical protein CBS101457_000654 [Exobasidium rhododendri]